MEHALPTDRDSGLFPSTCWSEIQAGGAGRERAFERLAHDYAGPIAAFLGTALGRRDAADLAQDFFVWVLESGWLAKADPARGRFRAFLATSLRHYVADAERARTAERRGGGRAPRSLDGSAAAGDGAPAELADPRARTPEQALDEAWRVELVAAALERTRAELEGAGKGLAFDLFRAYFLEPEPDVDYRALAERHGIAASDVSNHLMRAKQAYRAHLRALVLETVRSSAELDLELRWLVHGGRP